MYKYFLYLIVFFIAFKNVRYTKDLSMYDPVDPDLFENQQALKENRSFLYNRRIAKFSDNGYGIEFLADNLFDKTFYYDFQGNLKQVVYDVYPTRITSYNYLISIYNKIFPYKSYIYILVENYLL